VVLLQVLLVLWFAWSASRTGPRHVPVVVAGPPPATVALAERLEAERPGAFDITTVAGPAEADAAVRDRRAYAAFVADSGGVTLHVASAASPTVALLLGQAAQQLASGKPVPVVDVVASPPDDPRGAGLASGVLPLLLTNLGCGMAVYLVVSTVGARLLGLVGFGILAGFVEAGALHGLGVLTGDYLADAAAIGLVALAVSATVAGLGAAFGRAGIVLGALVVFFVGNPISGLNSAPELLPEPWGDVGQALPPGAGASLLRSVSFFSGAGSARPLWTLIAWAAAGLILTAAVHRRRLSRATDSTAGAEPAAPALATHRTEP
jgi:hypothetical protein